MRRQWRSQKLEKNKTNLFLQIIWSGIGEGFTPYPNTSVYAILSVWNNLGEAENNIEEREIYENYRTHSIENWTVSFLQFQAKVIGIKLTHLSPIKTNSRKKIICWPH